MVRVQGLHRVDAAGRAARRRIGSEAIAQAGSTMGLFVVGGGGGGGRRGEDVEILLDGFGCLEVDIANRSHLT